MRRFRSPRLLVPLLICVLLGSPVLTAGCSAIVTEDPPVADSTFARVLVELHLLDGRRRQGMTLPKAAEDTVLAHYGVTRTDFERTLEHYSSHPKAFTTLYNAVLDSLRAIEQDLPPAPSSAATK
jgi:hypothetical protein